VGVILGLVLGSLFILISSYLSIIDWNQLPEGVIGTSHGKTHIFKTRVKKV